MGDPARKKTITAQGVQDARRLHQRDIQNADQRDEGETRYNESAVAAEMVWAASATGSVDEAS
jgi:hypothetical protein